MAGLDTINTRSIHLHPKIKHQELTDEIWVVAPQLIMQLLLVGCIDRVPKSATTSGDVPDIVWSRVAKVLEI